MANEICDIFHYTNHLKNLVQTSPPSTRAQEWLVTNFAINDSVAAFLVAGMLIVCCWTVINYIMRVVIAVLWPILMMMIVVIAVPQLRSGHALDLCVILISMCRNALQDIVYFVTKVGDQTQCVLNEMEVRGNFTAAGVAAAADVATAMVTE